MLATLMRLSSPASVSNFHNDLLKWFLRAEDFGNENDLDDGQVVEFLKGVSDAYTAVSPVGDGEKVVSGEGCEMAAYNAFYKYLPKYYEKRMQKPCERDFSDWWPGDLGCEALAQATLPLKTAQEIGRLFAEREFDDAVAMQEYIERREVEDGPEWWRQR